MTQGRKVYAQQVGISLALPSHLGARRGLEELVDIGVAQLLVAAHVRDMVTAAELVGEGNVDNHMPISTEVGVLDDKKIAATGLAVVLARRKDVVALCGQARVMTDLVQRIQVCFLQVWM
jgi:hypothetical protein